MRLHSICCKPRVLIFRNSRNLNEKIFRGGTEEHAIYKIGPQTIRNAQYERIAEAEQRNTNLRIGEFKQHGTLKAVNNSQEKHEQANIKKLVSG